MDSSNHGATGPVDLEPANLPTLEALSRRLLPMVPRSTSPNLISLLTFAACWVSAGLATVSPHVAHPLNAGTLVAAGMTMVAAAIGDCLDGMQARRIGRTSRIGELLDHGGDSITVPLAAVALCLALQLPPWATVGVVVTCAMIFNAQIVLQHNGGVFVETATDGTNVQLGVAAGYVLIAATFGLVDRNTVWLEWALCGAALAAIVRQLQEAYFFYPMLRQHGGLGSHLRFAASCFCFGLAHVFGTIDSYAFCAAAVTISFRITGRYVLWSLIGRPFDGHDRVIAAGLGGILLVTAVGRLSQAPPALDLNLAVWVLCGYLVSSNVVDLARSYGALR